MTKPSKNLSPMSGLKDAKKNKDREIFQENATC